jgi:hypothetical protein
LVVVLSDAAAIALGANPLSSLIGSIFAAMLFTAFRKVGGAVLGSSVLLVAWLAGETSLALVLVEHTQRSLGSVEWIAVTLGVLGNFLLAYAAPTWAGAFVGRRVTFGTGWLSAAVVAATLSAAFASVAGRFG